MRLTLVVAATMLLGFPSTGKPQDNVSFETAPRFLVDAEIVGSSRGQSLIAARLYFDEIEQKYHFDGQRNRPDRANGKQKLSLLQSQLLKRNVQNLKFRSVEGNELTVDQVRERLAKDVAVLLLPRDASLHPAIKAVLKPDTIIVTKYRGASPLKVIARPEP